MRNSWNRTCMALAPLWAGMLRLADVVQAVAKFMAALLVIASFVVVTLHFLHVEISRSVPDAWPIWEPSGIPGIPAAWWRSRAAYHVIWLAVWR